MTFFEVGLFRYLPWTAVIHHRFSFFFLGHTASRCIYPSLQCFYIFRFDLHSIHELRMIDIRRHAADFGRSLYHLTWVEKLVLVAIAAVFVALATPRVRWASDGEIRIPVHVFIFDADHGSPIPAARVTIFRSTPLQNLQDRGQSGQAQPRTSLLELGGSPC